MKPYKIPTYFNGDLLHALKHTLLFEMEPNVQTLTSP